MRIVELVSSVLKVALPGSNRKLGKHRVSLVFNVSYVQIFCVLASTSINSQGVSVLGENSRSQKFLRLGTSSDRKRWSSP